MYYDRRLSEPLLDLLRPGAPLGWLATWVRSPAAAARHARVDFRRNDDDHALGAVMVYLGRTRPLVVVGRPNAVELTADPRYRDQAPRLFQVWPRAALGDLQAGLQALLERCAVHATLLTGEAAAHAGLVRRYALDRRPGEPAVVDTEARIGFRRDGPRSGTAVRDAHEAGLRARFPAFGGSFPWKLDAVAILDGGRLGLVELKKESGDLVEAVRQAAAHAAAWEALARGGLSIDGLVRQKIDVGLLDPQVPRLVPGRPVPIVAAPDADPRWADRWRRETTSVRAALAPLLGDLRFWRLDATGAIAEEAAP